jgi:carbon-monoxide dehydrogenase large subunit
MGQFGMGQAVRRKEDERFLRGTGSYVDDINLPGQAYASFLRSPHAHAEIRRIDTRAARAMPGVLAVRTAAEVKAAGLPPIRCAAPLKNRDGRPLFNPGRPVLADMRVRHVGDPVAMVVAKSVAQARDAAEAIEVDYEPLPAVVDLARAVEPGAPLVWPEATGNIALDFGMGNEEATNAAFAKAARVVRAEMPISRVVIASIEPRGLVASHDRESDRYTVHTCSQGVIGMRAMLAANLGVPQDKVRVLLPDVGGSFGMKGMNFPECTLVPWMARELGQPVKWVSDRSEAFVTDTQGREQQVIAEMALDAEGRFLAVRGDILANMGGYLSNFSVFIPSLAGTRIFSGLYRIPAVFVRIRSVYTNTVWVDAYRGAGRPETSFTIESLVDAVARETGVSREDIRRKNLIPAEAMPYTLPTAPGTVYDSGDFPGVMDKGLAHADRTGFDVRRAASMKNGLLRGLGLSTYMEITANVPAERAEVTFTAEDRIRFACGSGPTGQGHETAFAQVLADKLGVEFDAIDMVFRDSDALKQGSGTGGAKSLMLAGTAIVQASEKIIARGREAAGHFLEVAASEVEFRDGRFTIVGTDRSIAIMDLAKRLRLAKQLPAGVPATLDDFGLSTSDKQTFPNGCHVCEVEIDPDTGTISIDRYHVLDDFGFVMNPLILGGQIHGGIVQGAAQILFEHAAFDTDSGQLQTGTFMDYALPRASDMPEFSLETANQPCKTNVLGVKGAGEAGTVGSMGAVASAISDAMQSAGAKFPGMPATAERIWKALREARA